jgi:hypothetical protein
MMISMRSICGFAGGFALSAGLMLPMTASALEVHKWKDDQGVVQYSGSPPRA